MQTKLLHDNAGKRTFAVILQTGDEAMPYGDLRYPARSPYGALKPEGLGGAFPVRRPSQLRRDDDTLFLPLRSEVGVKPRNRLSAT